MATIGDPLADIGYLMIHWVQAADPPQPVRLQQRHRPAGVPHAGSEMVARYEQRSGRSVAALDWYVTLALWKAAVFMEGNYKRAVLGHHRRPVPEDVRRGRRRAGPARAGRHPQRRSERATVTTPCGLLVDWGGVMTTEPVRLVPRLLRSRGLSPEPSASASAPTGRAASSSIGLETGALPEEEFEPRFAEILGVSAGGLIDRMFAGGGPTRRCRPRSGGPAQPASAPA